MEREFGGDGDCRCLPPLMSRRGKASISKREYGSDYLQHNSKEARLLLETNTDGYFNNDLLLKQVDKAITVFEDKYPHAQLLFLFDSATSLKKYTDSHTIKGWGVPWDMWIQ